MAERFSRAEPAAAKLLREAGLCAEDVSGHPWLVPLLQGYAVLGASLAADLVKDGRTPVCAKGCDICCSQPIPATPPEIAGMALYLKRHGYPERKNPAIPYPCVFLEDGVCGIYPLRPIACRRYLVFGRPCVSGENLVDSRPGEVLWPSSHALLHVLRMSAVYYDPLGLLSRNAAPDMRFFQSRTLLLHEVDWLTFKP